MTLTEKEARNKWCPFTGNRSPEMPPLREEHDDADGCLGSGCMAWRWVRSALGEKDPDRQGYCGLSGDQPKRDHDKRTPPTGRLS